MMTNAIIRIKYKRIIMVLLLFVCVLLTSYRQVYAGDLNIEVLDVGQGLSVLFESDGHYMIYDGGGREKSSYVVSYLKKQGIETFDYVVASHYDEDHISGLVGVLNVFNCNTVLSPDYEADTSIYTSFVKAEYSSDADVVHPEQGQKFYLGSSEFTVVGPAEYKDGTDNDNSIAIRIANQKISCLVCGDAETKEESEILASGIDFASDIYIVSHHGSGSSTSEEFINEIAPTAVVISCGMNNSYGHPDAGVMERLQRRGCYLFRTDQQGEITLSTDGAEIYTGQEVCSDWSAGSSLTDEPEVNEMLGNTDINENDNVGSEYVCNENTKKFHYPSCNSVSQMKEKNKRYTGQSRDELISQGYDPCKNCNP